MAVVICDRDAVIAHSGVSRKEYADKQLSDELENIIENRSLYMWNEGEEKLPVIRDGGSHFISCAMPIVSEGDVVGCVVSAKPLEGGNTDRLAFDIEAKLIQTAAGFLGRQLEP